MAQKLPSGGKRTRRITFLILAIVILSGMSRAIACTPVPLTERQIRVKDIFDAWDRRFNKGDGYSAYDNRNGILANNEPAVINAYLRMYEATKDVKYLRKAVVHGDRILAHRDDIAGHTNYRGVSAPVWSDRNPKYVRDGKAYPFVLESGLLIRPLAYLAYLIRNEACLHKIKTPDGRQFISIAREYIERSKETVKYHNENWRSDTIYGLPIGFYVLPDDADFVSGTEPGKPVPTNYQTAMGSALLSLHMATRDPSYKERADRLGYFFLYELRYKLGDYSVFNYWPLMNYYPVGHVIGSNKADDISHAALSMEFMRLYYENSLGIFYRTEIKRLSNTFLSKLDKGNGRFAHRVDGSGTATQSGMHQVGQFAFLSDQDPRVFEVVENTLLHSLDLLNTPPASTSGYLSLANYLYQAVKRFPFGTSRCPWAKACRTDDDCISSSEIKFAYHAADAVDTKCYAPSSSAAVTNAACYGDPPTTGTLGDFWLFDAGTQSIPGAACEDPPSSTVRAWNTTQRKRRVCARKYKCQ